MVIFSNNTDDDERKMVRMIKRILITLGLDFWNMMDRGVQLALSKEGFQPF